MKKTIFFLLIIIFSFIISFVLYKKKTNTNIDIRSSEIKNRVKLAWNYLKKMVANQGVFKYEYNPQKDKIEKGYNVLRHIGSIYAMIKVWDSYELQGLREKIDLSIWWTKNRIITKDDRAVILDEDGDVKLWGNALWIIMLTEYYKVFGDEKNLEIAKKLGQWIINNQQSSGRFHIHKMNWKNQKTSSFRSNYYPWEAIFALGKLYEISKEKKRLDASYKWAKYTCNRWLKDQKIEPAEHDHWLLYWIRIIQKYKKDDELINATKKIVDSMINTQNVYKKNTNNKKWSGSWYSPPRYTPTSTRCEWLSASYRIFQNLKEKKYTNKIKESLKKSYTFLKNWQITDKNNNNFPNPQKALWWIPKSLSNTNIRIDYVQHTISCFLWIENIQKTE